ncbi:STAS/SEC14 domain-containing protein [Inquilinus limosus]|uniref:STAS/SEC14 domain-containing protein n=1 Tax=Inquilinus limosus TaxID=171674 RepID=UPI003F151351
MIEILPAPDHVVAMRLAGVLSEADYGRAIAETEAKLQRHDRVGAYVDMTDFDDMTAEAAARYASFSREKMGQAGRFPRKAVITDKQWLRVLIEAIDPLVPEVEARAFTSSERDKAMAWASEVASA